ncbi:hypothetical protein [Altererythrobacter sp. MTPC7]|uniref:hypothetical protein n=1 Tax=Altererythrobacter sp. MTPC7 TaxID=3056567 RepID=UPI0036F31A89
MTGLASLALFASATAVSPDAAAEELRDHFLRFCISAAVAEIPAIASEYRWVEVAPTGEENLPRIFTPEGKDFPTLVLVPTRQSDASSLTCTVYDPAIEREDLVAAASQALGDFRQKADSDNIAWMTPDGRTVVGRNIRVSTFESERKVFALSVRKTL